VNQESGDYVQFYNYKWVFFFWNGTNLILTNLMPEITSFPLNWLCSCTIIFGSLWAIDLEIDAYLWWSMEHLL